MCIHYRIYFGPFCNIERHCCSYRRPFQVVFMYKQSPWVIVMWFLSKIKRRWGLNNVPWSCALYLLNVYLSEIAFSFLGLSLTIVFSADHQVVPCALGIFWGYRSTKWSYFLCTVLVSRGLCCSLNSTCVVVDAGQKPIVHYEVHSLNILGWRYMLQWWKEHKLGGRVHGCHSPKSSK